MSTHWHILTGEYPPQPGGVSDYTRLVASGLAEAGDLVDIWAPPCDGESPNDPGVTVHRLPDHFGFRSWRALDQQFAAPAASRRLLVQYVPHAFGWKALNVPFCLWLRSHRRDQVWVMFHEVAFPIASSQSLPRNALGVVTRSMAALVAGAAERSFVSIPAWAPVVESLSARPTPITWLPVPSSIPIVDDRAASAAIRARYAPARPLVGHFGTCGDLIRPLLDESLPTLVAACDCAVVLFGRGSDVLARDLTARHPTLDGRLHGLGALPEADVSRHLAACDLMLQPYPDGVSSRRTSVMAPLAHGRPVLTTSGPLTETLWAERGAVVLVPAGDGPALATAAVRLLGDPVRLARLGADARALYDTRFGLASTIAALRSADDEPMSLLAVS